MSSTLKGLPRTGQVLHGEVAQSSDTATTAACSKGRASACRVGRRKDKAQLKLSCWVPLHNSGTIRRLHQEFS